MKSFVCNVLVMFGVLASSGERSYCLCVHLQGNRFLISGNVTFYVQRSLGNVVLSHVLIYTVHGMLHCRESEWLC